MREYFCGWYFKCQSDTATAAVIPAVHRSKEKNSCSVQFITDNGAWNVDLPYELFSRGKDGSVQVAGSSFGSDGINLNLHTSDFFAEGTLSFGALSPIKYDIMGPFKYVPFMECRHSVVSMKHSVNGDLHINGTSYRFRDAVGYIEGDRGYSFPKEYAWTQCHFGDGSLMLSVADIPLCGTHFTGVICAVQYRGREYRLATYLGAKVVKIKDGEIVVRQGKNIFEAKLIEKHAHPLLAPKSGAMTRTIRESASCRAAYRFEQNGSTLFDFETEKAAFEYEYSR